MGDQTELRGIASRHAEFFREVVAVARRHGMDHLTLTFRDSFGVKLPDGEPYNAYAGLTGTWHTGRHGDREKLSLEWRVQMSMPELDGTP